MTLWIDQIDACMEFGYESPYTHLVIRYDGTVDPDDTFSSIPYEKGFSLLWYLQTIFGVEKFEAFLKVNRVVKVWPSNAFFFFFRLSLSRLFLNFDVPSRKFRKIEVFLKINFVIQWKAYIAEFSYKAITTEDWKSFLYKFFDSEKEKFEQVDWDLWFNKPGSFFLL